jgi:hypothetical protein
MRKMNEHDVTRLLRQANVIDVADLPDPRESREAQRLLASIVDPAPNQRQPTLRVSGPSWWYRRRRLLVVALALFIALLVAASFVGARVFNLFWAHGTPVKTSSLGAQDRWLLEHIGVGSGEKRIERIASDGRLAFYVIHGHEGKMCIATGPSEGRPAIGSSACGAASDLRKELLRKNIPSTHRSGGKSSPKRAR